MDRLKSVSPRLAAYGRTLPKTKAEFDAIVMTGEMAAPVSKIDLDAHHALVGNMAPATVQVPRAAGEGGTEVVIVERAVRVSDVPELDKLALSDFVVDFSSVEKPAIGKLDEAALHAYADSLCREAGITV